MPYSTVAKNLMVDALAAVALRVALYSAYSANGASNELAGGSPAYARKVIAWSAASGGAADDTTAPVFDVPPLGQVAFMGFWNAAATVFYGMDPVGGQPKKFMEVVPGSDVFTVEGHGYTDGDYVCFFTALGSTLPTGITEGTLYRVRDATTDTFKVALTAGGTAIDITADGRGIVVKVLVEVFTGQGTYTASDVDLDLNGL